MMLCVEDVNVLIVVYCVGYSFVYFLIVFCKCYGILLSDICVLFNVMDYEELMGVVI